MPKVKTHEIIPRDYGLSFYSQGASITVIPSHYFLAAILMCEERELDERLRKYQEFKKRQLRKEHSNPHYPLFQLGKKAKILDLDFPELKEEVLERILKKDGVKTLYIAGGKDTVQDCNYGSVVSTGKVRTRHDARVSDAQKYRRARIGNPTLNQYGTLGFTDLSCTCDNTFWEETKGREVRVTCYHIAALNIFLYDALKNGAAENKVTLEDKINRDIATPFSISPRKLGDNNYLDMEVLFAYYVAGLNHFQINQRLLPLGFSFLSPAMQTMIMRRRVSYEVIRQGRKRAEVPADYLFDEVKLISKIRQRLRQEGYEREGLCIEHPRTEYETIAERYVKDENMISLVTPTTRLPPYAILKKPIGQPSMYTVPADTNEHPFLRLNKKRHGFDDMTRRPVEETIFLPGSSHTGVYIPKKVFERYKEIKASI